MRPYYEADGITIYHGDCREILPALSGVDAVITDPPYGIGAEYGIAFDDSPEYVRDVVVGGVLPLCRDAAAVTLLTPGVANLWAYPPPTWTLAWFAPGGTGSGPWGFTTWQPVLAYGPDPFLSRGLGRRPDGLVKQFKRASEGQRAEANARFAHPCQKPEGFAGWLVARGSIEGHTVLDPFAGSGTMHYIGGRVRTVEEVRADADPDERILLSNMECNGYARVWQTTEGWRWTQPLRDDDVVLSHAQQGVTPEPSE